MQGDGPLFFKGWRGFEGKVFSTLLHHLPSVSESVRVFYICPIVRKTEIEQGSKQATYRLKESLDSIRRRSCIIFS
jgi:hypothetical protein